MKNRRTNRSLKSRASRKAKQICHNAVNVERLEDRTLLTTFVVSNVNDSGAGSLRQAICDANVDTTADVIQFSLGTGPVTISPASALPTITNPLTIDGTTQGGFTGTPLIRIDGATASSDGLTVTAGNTEIRSLALTGFNSAIVLSGPNGHNVVQGCIIGLDPTDLNPDRSSGNGNYGIDISSPNSLIGGLMPGQGNVIAASDQSGILVNADNTTIQGNLLGTDAASHTGLGNGQEGVEVDSGSGTLIGGAGAAGNVIASNTGEGIVVNGAGSTTIQGNWIGTDATGVIDLGNSGNGIKVLANISGSNLLIDQNVLVASNGDGIHLEGVTGATITGNLIGTDNAHTLDNLLANSGFGVSVLAASTGNVIGGNTTASRNVISGNDGAGVHIEDSSNTTVIGNYIGTTIDGGAALGNSTGVEVYGTSTGTIIGTPHHGNVISGNGGDGIYLGAASTVQGNLIGTAADGTTDLGNGFEGVDIDSSNNIIGGTADCEGNTIAFNQDEGIQVYSGTGNSIRGNSMHDNVTLGIDLIALDNSDSQIFGATPNGPSQHGANLLQHFPEFTSVTGSSGTVNIVGTLDAPTGTYAIDLFASSNPHSTGFGEGEVYLGTVSVTTDGAGHGTFRATYSGVTGSYVTGTATDSAGNTSEFSPALGITAAASVNTATGLTSSANPSVFGNAVTLTATVTFGIGQVATTGNVQFYEGATAIGSPVAVNASGVATFTLPTSLSVGTHTYTASYLGNGNTLNPSNSAPLTQQVTAATTATALTSSQNPSVIGQNVTFTATVTSAAGTPTGTVIFKSGTDPSSTTLATITLNGSGIATFITPILGLGSHSITAVYQGATNFSTSTSPVVDQQVNPVTTTTALTSSLNPSTYGQTVTITATVTGSSDGAGTPTGSITFTGVGDDPITVDLDINGHASLELSNLSVATYTITATYDADPFFVTSSATLSQVVNKAVSTTTLASTLNPSTFGQSVTFTATVTPSATGTATGTVTFIDGLSPLGTFPVQSNGTASVTLSTLSVATHHITATYSGDTTFTGSAATLDETVQLAATSTAVSTSTNPSVFGQSVTIIANVTSPAGTRTGMVMFYDGATFLGQSTLSSGTASFVVPAFGVGNHSIAVHYSGDSSFAASDGSTLQVVNPANTATTVTSSIDPSVFGQSVTFTASVSVTAPGAGTLAGTVTFFDGGTPIGSATLSGTTATLTLSTLATGHHSITAQYQASSNFNSSTSPALDQEVDAASTTTTLTSSTNPSPFGQTVTFTATVAAIAPGAGTPDGTITFTDGSTTLGTVTLVGGVATLTSNALTTGSHNITATYSGSISFNASSVTITQSITPLATATTVSSSVNPSVFGQSVTLTATVTGGSSITGTVTFFDGSTNLGTATLSSGGATLTLSNLSVANHPITAQYSGDTNFTASTSPAIDQVVSAAATATTVSASTNPSPFTTSVTFTATVAPIAPGAGTPTGTITFFDGATAIGTVTLSGGSATLSTATLSTGTHSITATYSSNSTSFTTSTSNPLTQTVTALPTTTTLTGSPNPSTPGQSVTFTATVAGGNSTTGVPTGTVTFFDGSTALGTVTLASGVATFSTSALATGSHSITAVYNATSNFTTSTSNPVTQTVSAPANGSIIGFVYNDANNNGLFDGGELPISGVTLTLTGTNDLSQAVTLTASSDSTGAYRFDNLRPGTYKVTETQPANYGDGLDAKNNVVIAGSNTTDAISGITLLSGATAANNNFGELQLTISGTVLTDTTGNGLSNDDAAMSGVLVNLYADTNHSGTLDTGDSIIDHVTTGASGTYSFTKVPGRYFIQEVTPSGYLRTAPAVATFYNINAPIGGNSIGNDFDNFMVDCNLSDITNISYLINGTTIVSQLRGNTHQGDVVEAIFTVPAGDAPHSYSLVSYTAPSAVFDASVASQQMVYDTDSGVFGPGVHTLTVTIPDSFFQIDFVCGNIIDRLGPANSNIFYTPQGRLIDADNNGTQACINGPGSISGFTYVDINNNGLIDLNDGVIPGVKVTLTGTNDKGAAVSMTEFSDDDGQYFFGGLRPGTYTVTETQPTGITDGKDTLGTIAGASASNFGTVGADKFTNIKIATNQDAVNYNFGENDCGVQCGQAATIGFWQNSNGQALIKSLNGGSSATNLGIWLANTYPNLYGSAAGVANLLGKTNAQIASFYTTLFKTTGQKLDAQVMSVALAIYVTDSGHAGTAGTNYGFTVNDTGLAVATFSVGSNGAAFGFANNTTLTVGTLMDVANDRSWAGVLWDVDHTGVINSTEQAWRNMANTIFSAINTTGDIT